MNKNRQSGEKSPLIEALPVIGHGLLNYQDDIEMLNSLPPTHKASARILQRSRNCRLFNQKFLIFKPTLPCRVQ